MRWRDLRIWFKLLIVFGICFIFCIGITVWNNNSLNKIEAENISNQTDMLVTHTINNSLALRILSFQNQALDFQLSGNATQLQSSLNSFSSFVSNLKGDNSIQNKQLEGIYRSQLLKINQVLAKLQVESQQLSASSNSSESASQQLMVNFKEGLNEIGIITEQMMANGQKQINDQYNLVKSKKLKQKSVIVFVQIGVLILFILLFVFLVYSIESSKRSTIRIAKQLSEGNLAIDFGKIYNDDFGQITLSMVNLQVKMREIVNHIHETMASVKKASSELFSGSQLISDGANNQAATSNEISATMDQIAIIARQTTESANQTDQIAKRAFNGIQKGANDVKTTFSVIEEIAEKNSVISEISYQTKILSINASVEAARAAEFGKGFGVIADQVKRLAEDTQKSASEIESVSSKGVELTGELSGQLSELVTEFQKTSDLIGQVAESGNEQYEAIQQVTMAIQDLNNITQQNASSSEELAASSEQLVQLSDELADLLKFFKLENVEEEVIEKTELVESVSEKNDDETDEEIINRSFFKARSSKHASEDSEQVLTIDELLSRQREAFGSFDEPYFDMQNSKDEKEEEKYSSFFSQHEGIKDDSFDDDQSIEEEENDLNPDVKGIRINLADNDEMDNHFKKIK